MTLHSLTFSFSPELAPVCEPASRRRIRVLQDAFPAVLDWSVACAVLAPDGHEDLMFEARVGALLENGNLVEAKVSRPDLLAALRIAFNTVEEQLHAESEQARFRAFEWLGKLKGRNGLRRGAGR